MGCFEIIRVEKLKTMACVKRSALHTFREIPVENAISEKMVENDFFDKKSADDVFQAVASRIATLDKKDKQAVRCVEFFISASPEQFEAGGCLHDREAQNRYFDDALNWIREKHGSENVVCHAVHRDEKTPHLVVYAVPVVKREAGTRKRSFVRKGVGRVTEDVPVPERTELGCKAFYGDPNSFKKLQDDFHAGVGRGHGLDRGVSRADARKHKKTAVWYAEEQAKLDAAKKELDRQKANLDVLGGKVEAGRVAHNEQMKKLNAAIEAHNLKSQNFKQEKADFEADKAASLAALAEIKLNLSQRETDLKANEDSLVQRVITERIRPVEIKLKADIAAFKEDRAAFRTEAAEFQEMTKSYTPGQIVDGIKSLEKANVKPLGRSGGR